MTYTNCVLQKFTIIILLLCCALGYAQSDSTYLQRVQALRTKSDFNRYDKEHIDLLYDAALDLYDSNHDSMYLLINEGLELSLKSNYKNGEGYAYMRLGNYYAITSQFDDSKKYYEKAIDLATQYKLHELRIFCLNNYGLGLHEIGDNANALLKFLEGVELAKKIGQKANLASLYNNISRLYSAMNDYETSLSFLEKTKEICVENNNERLLMTLSLMAKEYVNLNDYEAAEKAIDPALSYAESSNQKGWLGYCYRIKGLIAFKKGLYESSLQWYLKGKEIFDSYNDFYESTFIYNGIAVSYLALNQYSTAETYAIRGNSIAKEANFLEGIIITSQTLNSIYSQQKEYEKAWQFQEEYLIAYKKQYEDNFRNTLGMLKSELKFENEKKQLLASNRQALAKQKNYIYLAIIFVIFLIVVLLFVYRDYSKQRHFNTTLKKKQDALLQRERDLSESNNTKDKLFSIIAHDLKGPITNFYGIMKMYLNGDVSKEESQFLFPKALEDLGAVNEMLNNLLVWGKNQIQGNIKQPKNISLNHYVNENITLLKPMAEKKSITLQSKLVEEMICFCDKDHIDIVLRNLISNAIKFTNTNGKIIVDAKYLDNSIQISVSDDGVGMDKKTLNNLFTNKSIKSTYGTNNEKGTGLGLSLCAEMVEKNEGTIHVSSTLNEGTTVYFTLPKRRLFEVAV